jgi:hypothetical protein
MWLDANENENGREWMCTDDHDDGDGDAGDDDNKESECE